MIKPTPQERDLLPAATQWYLNEIEAEIQQLRQQLAEAKAIVDKLPKTADGVPIVPKMKLWQIDPQGFINAPPDMIGADPNPRPWSFSTPPTECGTFCVRRFPVYSSKDAASASILAIEAAQAARSNSGK